MSKVKKVLLILLSIIMCMKLPAFNVYAQENIDTTTSKSTNISSEITDFYCETTELMSDGFFEGSAGKNFTLERDRNAAQMSDNPNTRVTGTLDSNNPQDFYFFSITESSRFMLARLTSSNTNYIAHLFVYDPSTGDASATNYYGFSGTLIQLNGLPVGDYVFAIYSYDGSYNASYTFDINASNPAANISSVNFLKSDLSIFVFETTSGDVYGNGSFIYNTSATTNSNLSWTRVYEYSWGSGFEQRTHSIYNVHVSGMSTPVSYTSNYASSSCAVLIYCDIGTGFSYFYSYYQSGIDPIHQTSATDTSGRVTPRALDSYDFAEGNQHIIVYDLITGSAIDFYSTLNEFYANGYEPQPTISFY